MRLHFEKLGSGSPLIVLHGLFGSLENWGSLNRRFAEHFEVYAVDQRNHGRSPHSWEMTYATMAEDIRELLDGNGVLRARVLGHSMGGKTAMQLALLHPERVNRLVVVDMGPQRYPAQHRELIQALLSLELERFQTRQQVEKALAARIPEGAVRRFLLKNLGRDSGGKLEWRLGLGEIAANYDRLLEGVGESGRFEGPVLFLRGERSDYLGNSDLEQIRQRFPQFVLETIAGTGHWLHAEAPVAVVQAVLTFLR